MSLEKRIAKLEQQTVPAGAAIGFVLVEPPPGLSPEEHDTWATAQYADGDPVFTLDLGAASLARLHE